MKLPTLIKTDNLIPWCHSHLLRWLTDSVCEVCSSPCKTTSYLSLQYSCLENPMDRGGWQAAVHGVFESRTGLSDFTFTFHFHALEKEMATHSTVLAWRIPGTGEPGGLPSMWSHRVRHDGSDLAATASITSFLLNSFCDKTSGTWASISPETKRVISDKRQWV